MAIFTKVAENLDEVDIIIAGGGAAGCIVASRLAAADPSLRILVIEAGRNNHNDPSIKFPAFYLQHLLPGGKFTKFLRGSKSKELGGREPVVAAGCGLGGGSSINAVMYARGQKTDFNSWNTQGWSADDLLPYLKKVENYHGLGDSKTHGHDGPVQISDGGYHGTIAVDDIIGALRQMGIPEVTDMQDLEQSHGVERCNRFVSPEGVRQDSAHTYLHPLLQDGKHSNLHVLVEAHVVRVLFDDGKRACGVEYTPSPGTDEVYYKVRAAKMVIVSGGACGSPLLLERSGVGDPEILRRAGVQTLIADVPGVGQSYQDHQMTFYPYKTDLPPHETLDRVLTGKEDPRSLIEAKSEILGWNSIDISVKMRPKTEVEIDALGPKFRDAWNRDYANNPNKPLMLMFMHSCFLGDLTAVPPGQYVTMVVYTPYPYSRGHLHITGPNVKDSPDFNPGFFTDADDVDLKMQLWAYKKQREAMHLTHMYQGEVASVNPEIPSYSETEGTGGLAYTPEDDVVIEDWLREHVGTVWHSMGTCKMAPREDLGVVDQNLNVYGVRGLKVIDLSIPPLNVAANTNNTAMVIGEKGADIIIEELGLGKVPSK
ncbi:alcohol oxidase-like protein [Xylaria cf. heliscus]|nr:alcohol oxidase-like protein [Xylaria cf. heliscus]